MTIIHIFSHNSGATELLWYDASHLTHQINIFAGWIACQIVTLDFPVAWCRREGKCLMYNHGSWFDKLIKVKTRKNIWQLRFIRFFILSSNVMIKSFFKMIIYLARQPIILNYIHLNRCGLNLKKGKWGSTILQAFLCVLRFMVLSLELKKEI